MKGRRISARAQRAKEALTPNVVECVARRVLPCRNDYTVIDAGELLAECLQFGVRTRGQFTRILLRHRRALRTYDQAPLTPLDQRVYRAEHGDEFVRERMRRQYLFSTEGLVRTALEWEFGDEYVAFYRSRDEAREPAAVPAQLPAGG